MTQTLPPLALALPIDPAELAVEIPDKNHGSAGINIGGNTVTRCTEWMDPDSRLLVRWLHDHGRRMKWEWPDLERETGISSTIAYRLWNDKYRYPLKKKDGTPSDDPKAGQRISIKSICERIAKIKKVAEARLSVFSTGFVKLSAYERVEWLCDKCLVRQKLGFVYSESQMGKTMAAKEYTRLHNGGQTTYIQIPPAGGVQFLARLIAKALHVNSATSFEHLVEDIIDAVDSSKLLIIDEVHRIFTTYQKTSVMRCFDLLRYIYDQTNCGMVLIGTNVFRDNLREGQFKQYLKQLKRRGLYEMQLPDVPPIDDLNLICEKFGLPPASGEAATVLNHLAAADGFGIVVTRLTDAAEYAQKKKEPLNWLHFTKVVEIIRKNSTYAKQQH